MPRQERMELRGSRNGLAIDADDHVARNQTRSRSRSAGIHDVDVCPFGRDIRINDSHTKQIGTIGKRYATDHQQRKE